MAMTIPQRRRFFLITAVVSLVLGVAILAWAIFNTAMGDRTVVDLVFIYIQGFGLLLTAVALIGQGRHLTSLMNPRDEADGGA